MSTFVFRLAAVAALALLAAACGSSAPQRVARLGTTSATTAVRVAAQGGPVAYSRCVRAHGVLRFPDPGSGGSIPKKSLQQLGVTAAQLQSAQGACRSLLPGGGRPPDQATRRQVKAQGLRFARCVRAHGVPRFPDPDATGRIPDPATVGVDQGSPTFRAANDACGKDRPPYMPSNAAYAAYARTHGGG